jgi:hypothetical protein
VVERGRILVTGSRDWRQPEVIHNALRLAAVQLAGEAGAANAPVLVSGDCPTGADAQAEYIWESWGLEIERHPADWKTYGRAAGFKRNEAMVDSGADIVLAFVRNESKGASSTVRLARKAGLTVWLYEDIEREPKEENDAGQEQPGGAVGA